MREYNRRDYELNKEKRLEYARKNKTKPTAAQSAEYNARWRAKNPGKGAAATRAWREKDPEHARRLARERDRANPAKRNAKRAAFRALLLKAKPPWFEQEKKAIAALYREAREKGMHVDHIYPLRGKMSCGLHCLANLQLLTPAENLAKSNKDPQ